MTSKHILYLLLCLVICASCKKQDAQDRTSTMGSIFKKKAVNTTGDYDLESILRGGELIITTLSGPETYYDYHGMGMGMQYMLAENFAESQGLSVRVEIAKDTLELVQKVREGAADMIAYPLSDAYLKASGLISAGYSKKGHWAVRKSAPQLAEALTDWYGDGVEIDVQKLLKERVQKSHHVTRRAQAVFLSRERGVISVYDNLFKDASAITGWDWKLIAAQAYQESAFDPNARSYVGARGLMQLMPKTAASLGLSQDEVCMPEKNVNAAARYIAKLTNTFSDIRNPEERVKFVLASYNGGVGHVRDAMALARKYGRNDQVWDNVAPYILGLQQPQFYKDPVVKYGYMIGTETAGYVQKIMERWRDYGGNVVVSGPPRLPSEAAASGQGNDAASRNADNATRKNRYASGTKVRRPDDPDFNQMEQ